MKYKIGDRVQIKSLDWYNENKDNLSFYTDSMALCFANEIVTIKSYGRYPDTYRIDEDEGDFLWTDDMIEGLVEEPKSKFKIGDKVIVSDTSGIWEITDMKDDTLYSLKRENHTATLTTYGGFLTLHEGTSDEMIENKVEEKSNACQKCAFAVRDDNPHCGLRGFTSRFNVEWCSAENDKAPNGYELQEDGYFSWVIKKKEYPKTYKECCEILGCSYNVQFDRCESSYESKLHDKLLALREVLICCYAYWKIAGEEMGLGKPWKPNWDKCNGTKYCIYPILNSIRHDAIANDEYENRILAFPTVEMKDAFYENFKEKIEKCKDLL